MVALLLLCLVFFSLPTSALAQPTCTPQSTQNTSITLAWDPQPQPPGSTLTAYVFERQTDAGPWVALPAPLLTASQTTDTGLVVGHTYTYRLRVSGTLADGTAMTTGFASHGSPPPCVTITVVAPPRPPASGLVGAWSFSEGTGTVATDSSPANHPATLVGSPTWAAGKFGTALALDGLSGYARVDTPGLVANDFTFSAWVFLGRNTAFQTIAELLTPASVGWELNLNGGGTIALWTNGAQRLVTTTTVPLNVWTYVTLRRTGATWQVFLGGVAQPQTGTDATVFAFGACPLLLGVDADSGCTGALNGFLQGRLDEVRVYTRALTATEILTDMATAITPTPPAVPLVAPGGLRVLP